MKRLLQLVFLMVAMVAHAQVNPMPGYVILKGGETLNGTIDYLTAEKNAQKCVFCKDGETEFREYSPSELQGYRLRDNHVYYVSKTFEVDHTPKTIFAEYLLQGGLSLFRYQEGGQQYYFLVDENGRVAQVKSHDLLLVTNTEELQMKHQAVDPGIRLLMKSEAARESLWRMPITASNMVRIVRDYNRDFCAESGDCVEYEYDVKASAPATPHFRIQAGCVWGRYRNHEQHANVVMPRIGIGCDLLFPRINPGLSLQFMLLIDRWDVSGEYFSKEEERVEQWSERFVYVESQVGISYVFMPHWPISPYVRGGVKLANVIVPLGLYVGAGIDCRVGKQHIRLSGNAEYFRSSLFPDDKFKHGISSFSLDLDIII